MTVSAEWLSARWAADERARAVTERSLLPLLIRHLAGQGLGDQSPAHLEVLDIGAGTGANRRWLEPRLPAPQRWVLLDSDPVILRQLGAGAGSAEVMIGGLEAVANWLDRTAGRPRLLTCSALLDILVTSDLDELCERLITFAVPALLSLSANGELSLEPPDPLDAPLLAAFNDHQRRDGRAGPDAPQRVATRLGRAGMQVLIESTPWRLTDDDDRPFVDRFLSERVTAAVQQRPQLLEAGTAWLNRRRTDAPGAPHRITVGHLDLLALPATR